MSISLESIADFTWGFSFKFLLEVDGKYYVWNDPDYPGGDNTITPFTGNPKNFVSKGFAGRIKGRHKILDYCGPDVKFVGC